MLVNEWLNNNELGINIWEKKYQYESETFEEWLDRVSNNNEDLKDIIINKRFLFGGRILSNRGLNKKGKKITLSNCYVLPQVEDSIEGIYKTCSDLARTFSYGGGVGIDISKLRPRGTKVNNTAKYTTGAVSFMDTFSKVAETIGQNGRRGALMISMNADHPDIEEFINIKTDLDKVTKANISVRLNDEFMKKVTGENKNPIYHSFFTKDDSIISTKDIDAKDLFMTLCKNNWDYAEPGILYWDRISNYNLLQYDKDFKYAGVNPCAEEPLPAGGSCLLGAFNLDAYVKDKVFDTEQFIIDISIVVKAMNEVLDEGLPLHPLDIQKKTVNDYRQIGIGVMGIADMLIHMGVEYGSDESINICDEIGKLLADHTLKCSSLLAKEYGAYPKYKDCVLDSDFIKNNASKDTIKTIKTYGLRNSQLLTIAPTGSISTMIGVSGGIEPIFENSYIRKTESLHGEDVYYKVYTPIVKKYMEDNNLQDENELPNYFITTKDLNSSKRISMQSIWQTHIDASISSTINLPKETSVEEIYNIYVEAWKKGLKGITVYRSGCKREGILTTSTEIPKELSRGEWKSLAKDTYYVKRNLSIGCGKLKLFIGYSPSEEKIQDLYIIKCGNGGCTRNLQALAISMSAVLRLGGSLDNLEKAFRGIDPCNSFISARAKGKELSKGNYCGAVILNEVNKFLEEIDKKESGEEKVKEKNTNANLTTQELLDKGLCPECKEPLNHIAGCVQCSNCGFSRCN